MKKIVSIGIVFLGVLILSACGNQKVNNNQNNPEAKIILFVGQGCPHCENVEKYMEDNKIRDKVNFDQKEVFLNKDNLKVMEEKARSCGIKDTKNLGVPLLWDGENGDKCYSGDKDIIDFFQRKAGGERGN